MRLALADAGDGMEDANFVVDTADKGILRLTKVSGPPLYLFLAANSYKWFFVMPSRCLAVLSHVLGECCHLS